MKAALNNTLDFTYRIVKFPYLMAFGSAFVVMAAVLGIIELLFIKP